jgi:hypothetical protein
MAQHNWAVSVDGNAPTVKLLGMTIVHKRNNPNLIPRVGCASGAQREVSIQHFDAGL